MKQIPLETIPKLGKLGLFDIHKGTKYEHKEGVEIIDKILNGATVIEYQGKEFNVREGEVVDLGDNIELKNILKKKVEKAKIQKARLKVTLGRFCFNGNHDFMLSHSDNDFLFKPKEKHLMFNLSMHGERVGNHQLMHGHATWKEKKAYKYCMKDNGCSWFKYNLISPAIEKGRDLFPFKPKEKHFKRLMEWVYPGTKYVHLGHTHIAETQALEYEGVVYIFYCRGVSEV